MNELNKKPSRNSKIVFENHFHFIEIIAWSVFPKTHFLKNNVKIMQFGKKTNNA